MLDYTGHACPCCNKPFAPGDDIVVCPECGAPYHRSCYQAQGRCMFESMHGPGFAWKPAPSAAAPVVCPGCGAGNAESAVFCSQCGTRLQEPDTPEDAAPNAQGPFDYAGGPWQNSAEGGPQGAPEGFLDPFGRLFAPGETVDDIPVQTWAAFLGSSSPYYLLNFKRMDLTGRKIAVSFSAFFLGPIYFFYRKMYKWGFIFAALSFLLEIPSLLGILIESGSSVTAGLSAAALQPLLNLAWVLSWVLMLVRGLLALWLYRSTAAGRIRTIQARWKDDGTQRAALNALGGTSIGAAIAYGLFSVMLLSILLVKLGGPGLYSMYLGL